MSHRSLCWCLVVLGVLVASAMLAIADSGFLRNDAAQYLSVARHLALGQGALTDLIYYDTHYAFGTVPAPQTVFPPGLPALVALVSLLGSGVVQAMLVVNAAAVALLPLLTYLLCVQLGGRGIGTAAVATLLSLTATSVVNGLQGNSEVLFTLVSVCALAVASGGMRRASSTWAWLVAAGGFAAFAFSIRYQGVFLLGAFGLVLGLRWIAAPSRQRFIDGLSFAVLPLVVVTFLVVRNFRLTGTTMGGPGAVAANESPLPDVAMATYWALSRLSGFSLARLASLGLAEILLVAAVLATIGAFVYRIRSSSRQGNARIEESTNPILYVALAYIAITAVVLLWLSLTRSIAYMQARYLLPMLPFGAVLVARALARTGELRQVWVLAPVVMWAFALCAGQWNVAQEQAATLDEFHSSYSELETALRSPLGPAAAQTVGELLRQEQAEGRPVFAFEAQRTGLLLRGPTLGAAPGSYTRREFDLETVLCIASHYNARYLISFPGLFVADAPRNASRTVFAELASGTPTESVTLVASGAGHSLYRMSADACRPVDGTDAQ